MFRHDPCHGSFIFWCAHVHIFTFHTCVPSPPQEHQKAEDVKTREAKTWQQQHRLVLEARGAAASGSGAASSGAGAAPSGSAAAAGTAPTKPKPLPKHISVDALRQYTPMVRGAYLWFENKTGRIRASYEVKGLQKSWSDPVSAAGIRASVLAVLPLQWAEHKKATGADSPWILK